MTVWSATQKAVFELLVADAEVHALVADRIYDGVPEDPVWPYVSFGPSDVPTYSDGASCVEGRTEALQIDVWSSAQGRLRLAKEVCDAVAAALHLARPDLTHGRLHEMRVTSMRVRPDADGITAHGVVALLIETTVET